MNDVLGLALIAAPVAIGAMVPPRHALLVALLGVGVAALAWAWYGGLSIHGEPTTLLFLLAVPFSAGAVMCAGIARLSAKWRRACLLPGAVLAAWALWFAPQAPANEPIMGPTWLLAFLVAVAAMAILVTVVRVELVEWRERAASASETHP